ncbi:MAG: hypothetical protein EXQ97_05705 [Alphaproteobacteria bacterium]|nr:hypothetical protein [Alphaproteobacteria bacterium]
MLLVVAGAGGWWALGRILPYVEGKATSGIGRTVTIGHISVDRWSSDPVIAVRYIRIADAAWRGEEPMVAIEIAMAQLDLSASLIFKVVLTELSIHRPRVRLSIDADGQESWSIDDAAEPVGEGPAVRQFVPLIERVVITEGVLVYSDAVRSIDLEATLATATGDTNGDINIRAKGTLEKYDLTVFFDGGKITVLHDTDVPYPIRVNVVAGPNRMEFSGTAADPFGMDGLYSDIDIVGRNLARSRRWLASWRPMPRLSH